MKDVIKAIYVRPGAKLYEVICENSLAALQSLVGGYIESVTIASNCAVICNDEGRINGMPYNCHIANVDFYGPVVLVGVDGDEFTDMPLSLEAVKEIGMVQRRIKE